MSAVDRAWERVEVIAPDRAGGRPVRLLHTSDCHLGNFILDGDKEREAFAALIEAALVIRPAVLVVAGDLYDHNRVSEDVIAWTLEQMSRLECPIIVLPGNHDHDVVFRLAAAADLARQPRITIITDPDGEIVELPEAGLTLWGRAHVDHTPDFRPLHGIPARPDNGWCVALGHGLTVDSQNSGGRGSPIYPADIEALGWDYVALGHVHAFRVIRDLPAPPVVYSGATASSRGGAPGAVLVEFHPATGVSFQTIDLTRYPG
jgi:DNA repair exonuclease SbcCD nuclease subunit